MTNGYKNECAFAKAINKKKYKNLSEKYKEFIKFIFNDIKANDILECKRYMTTDKADVYIKLNDVIKNISIKSGIRVSVHAERIESFTKFLKDIHINEHIINYLLMYHYGDFTLDGSGITRLPAKDLKERYEKEIRIFNKYVNYKSIIKKIIQRCLVEGTSRVNTADYIYYVDENLYASKEEIIDYMSNNKAQDIIAPHFSYLIYQNWNRNIIYNPKLESHRYYCQLKWPSIIDDLKIIRLNNSQKCVNNYKLIEK